MTERSYFVSQCYCAVATAFECGFGNKFLRLKIMPQAKTKLVVSAGRSPACSKIRLISSLPPSRSHRKRGWTTPMQQAAESSLKKKQHIALKSRSSNMKELGE
jgi:hypothetical protein